MADMTFEEILIKYEALVYTLAFRILGSKEEAEDMTQETFLKVHDRLSELDRIKNHGAWLRKITLNLCINHINRYKNRYMQESQFAPGQVVEPVDTSADVTKGVEVVERKMAVEEALMTLPVFSRLPLILFYMEEKSYEEIARELNVSLSKVKVDIMRGKEKLKELLARRGFVYE